MRLCSTSATTACICAEAAPGTLGKATAPQRQVRKQAPAVQRHAQPLAAHLDPGAGPGACAQRVRALLHPLQAPAREQHRLCQGAALTLMVPSLFSSLKSRLHRQSHIRKGFDYLSAFHLRARRSASAGACYKLQLLSHDRHLTDFLGNTLRRMPVCLNQHAAF